jgi:hypothetical protein
LKRKEVDLIQKTRKLPIPGRVLVKEGESVTPDSVVAVTSVPGTPRAVNVSYALGLEPQEAEEYLSVKQGEAIKQNAPLARYESLFGLYKKECLSPIDGVLEHYSKVSGQAIVRGMPVSVEVKAYLRGTVTKILPAEGVVVEAVGALVQGIFGIGGETHGDLVVLANSRSDVLEPKVIGPQCRGKIIVGGSIATSEALSKAVQEGAKAVITGGIKNEDLAKFLGYEVGVAITGQEDAGLSLVITEGFGKMAMSEKTFDLLKKFEGRLTCVNGTTQIRAGVIRPEIIIPREEISSQSILSGKGADAQTGIDRGTLVRIIRAPHFGQIGTVVSLPPALRRLESGSEARVVEVRLDRGDTIIVPRANVEIIE